MSILITTSFDPYTSNNKRQMRSSLTFQNTTGRPDPTNNHHVIGITDIVGWWVPYIVFAKTQTCFSSLTLDELDVLIESSSNYVASTLIIVPCPFANKNSPSPIHLDKSVHNKLDRLWVVPMANIQSMCEYKTKTQHARNYTSSCDCHHMNTLPCTWLEGPTRSLIPPHFSSFIRRSFEAWGLTWDDYG